MTKEKRTYNGERTVSSVNGVEKDWTVTCKRMKLYQYLIAYIQINSKLINDLNIRPEIIKFQGGKNLFDISLNNVFVCLFFVFRYDSKDKGNKAKVSKWSYHQT